MIEVGSVSLQQIVLSKIDRPSDPDRMEIDPVGIRELADSIREEGLHQPIVLRVVGDRYEIIAGDRRFQAHVLLGVPTIAAIVRDVDSTTCSIIRATENLQRTDLTVIEEARIYQRLHDGVGMSWEDIGRRTGKSPGNVKRRYDLLRLPVILIDALHKGLIGYAIAEELRRLGDVNRIEYFLKYAIDHGATRVVVAEWVREELATIRRGVDAGEGGGEGYVAPETRPVYVSCDICHGPLDVMKMVNMRLCPDCVKMIKDNT